MSEADAEEILATAYQSRDWATVDFLEALWTVDVHGETADTRTIETAADHIEHRLEH